MQKSHGSYCYVIHAVDNQRMTDVLCGGGVVHYSGMYYNIHDVRECHQARYGCNH